MYYNDENFDECSNPSLLSSNFVNNTTIENNCEESNVSFFFYYKI